MITAGLTTGSVATMSQELVDRLNARGELALLPYVVEVWQGRLLPGFNEAWECPRGS